MTTYPHATAASGTTGEDTAGPVIDTAMLGTADRGALAVGRLLGSMAASAPVRIAALAVKGGPDDVDEYHAEQCGQRLAELGDVLLFGGAPGEAAALVTGLVHALAVLAFREGGVRAFGHHWEGSRG